MPYVNITPVIVPSVKGLCTKPYSGHKNGCPNYAKKAGCPPSPLVLSDVIDIRKTVFAIYNRYPLSVHVQKMRDKFPSWSERQLYCCLYWQPTARRQLKAEIEKFLSEKWPQTVIVKCPEALGLNVTETMRQPLLELGQPTLEWPPVNYAYQIVLAGCPNPTAGGTDKGE